MSKVHVDPDDSLEFFHATIRGVRHVVLTDRGHRADFGPDVLEEIGLSPEESHIPLPVWVAIKMERDKIKVIKMRLES